MANEKLWLHCPSKKSCETFEIVIHSYSSKRRSSRRLFRTSHPQTSERPNRTKDHPPPTDRLVSTSAMGKIRIKHDKDEPSKSEVEDDDASSNHIEQVDEEEEENDDDGNEQLDEHEKDNDEDENDKEEEEIAEEQATDVVKSLKPKKIHKLSLTETSKFNEELKKRGVIYIARVPPRMTPTKIKALLSEFAEVTRIYLVEEDPTVRKRRKKEHGKSGGKRYVEGWAEMKNKEKAKHIAQSLNNTPISNHKRNPHYGRFRDRIQSFMRCSW